MVKHTNNKMLGFFGKVEVFLNKKEKELIIKFRKYFYLNFILLIIIAILSIESPIKNIFSNDSQINERYEKIEQKADSIAFLLHFLEHRDRYIFEKIYNSDPYPLQLLIAFTDIEHKPNFHKLNLKLDTLLKYLNIQEESYNKIMLSIDNRNDILESIPFLHPILDNNSFYISSKFGYRYDPFDSITKFHYGYDFVSQKGTPIIATGAGKISFANNSFGDLGKMVMIKHGYGYETIYAHLDNIYVKSGDIVDKNQIIGSMGSSGRSTGTHLHYEIRKDGYSINPSPYLDWIISDAIYEEILAYVNYSPNG